MYYEVVMLSDELVITPMYDNQRLMFASPTPTVPGVPSYVLRGQSVCPSLVQFSTVNKIYAK